VKLIVHELTDNDLAQELICPENMSVIAVRPHIYRHNFATGSLQIQILNDSDELMVESEEVDISDIGTSDYFHGYVRFDVSVGMQKGQAYKIKLVGLNGYSFTEDSYCGICNDYDLRKYDTDFSPSEGVYAPLDIEIWKITSR
jgi:hypothetical protein